VPPDGARDGSRAAPSSTACTATAGPSRNRYLVLYAFPRDGSDLGAWASRLGARSAVRSNAIAVKRLLREACTTHAEAIPQGHDVVVVARSDAAALAREHGLAGIECALAELLTSVKREGEVRA